NGEPVRSGPGLRPCLAYRSGSFYGPPDHETAEYEAGCDCGDTVDQKEKRKRYRCQKAPSCGTDAHSDIDSQTVYRHRGLALLGAHVNRERRQGRRTHRLGDEGPNQGDRKKGLESAGEGKHEENCAGEYKG